MTIRAIFPGRVRPGQDFYIALIQSISRAFREHKEPMSYTDRSRKQSQILDIVGNIEILSRMRLGKMARMVTLNYCKLGLKT